MPTITEFLEARIAEDESKANALLSATQDGYDINWYAERVLVECEAKRAIIELAQKASEDEKEYYDYEWQGTVKSSEPLTGDAILLALAAVYKDHSDYHLEWENH